MNEIIKVGIEGKGINVGPVWGGGTPKHFFIKVDTFEETILKIGLKINNEYIINTNANEYQKSIMQQKMPKTYTCPMILSQSLTEPDLPGNTNLQIMAPMQDMTPGAFYISPYFSFVGYNIVTKEFGVNIWFEYQPEDEENTYSELPQVLSSVPIINGELQTMVDGNGSIVDWIVL